MFCRPLRSLLFITALFTLGLAACARRETRAVERLAVPPLENLSNDVNLDWVGRAASAALVYDLSSAPDLFAQAVDSVAGASAIRPTRVLQGYFVVRNGKVEIHATLLDPRKTTTVANFALAGSPADDPVPLVNQLAKRVNASARSFPAGNASAFRDFGAGVSSTDRAAALRAFQSATAANPALVSASLGAARLLYESGDREGARKVLLAAMNAHPDSIDQARLEYLSAVAASDTAGRLKSLQTLQRLTPTDSQVPREIAELQLAQRKFQDALPNCELVTRLDPEDPQAWNQLGYCHAFVQNLSGARTALDRYRQLLPPQEVNPLDSLGEVSFYLGDFASAANYFVQAHEKNPSEFAGGELIKAAQARLMAGDLAAADALFQRYLGLLQHSQGPLAGFQQAQWEFLTGRRQAAMARLEKLVPAVNGEGQALALCQLSIWKLETGDGKAAADLSAQAVSVARSPRLQNLSALCRFLATPPTTRSGSPAVDAFALLFQKKFGEAVPTLETLYRDTNPSADSQVRTLLAWAYVETGREQQAQQMIERYPIPLSSGEPVFAALIFPRFFYLRGAVLEKEGKRADAKQSYELFLKYAGDLSDIFGDQARARQRVSAL